jgi:hypothetical protein
MYTVMCGLAIMGRSCLAGFRMHSGGAPGEVRSGPRGPRPARPVSANTIANGPGAPQLDSSEDGLSTFTAGTAGPGGSSPGVSFPKPRPHGVPVAASAPRWHTVSSA